MDPKAPEKKERLLAALDLGMAMIHLDARRPGVLVPPHLKGEPHLRLNLSYRFDPPDLSVGEWGVRCTLSFSGSRFQVAVPWSALFAVTSHVTKEPWLFPDDMPPEVLQMGGQDRVDTAAVVAPPKPARAVLRSVPAEAEPGAPREETPRPPSKPQAAPAAAVTETAPGDDGEPPKPKGRPHLRVIK